MRALPGESRVLDHHSTPNPAEPAGLLGPRVIGAVAALSRPGPEHRHSLKDFFKFQVLSPDPGVASITLHGSVADRWHRRTTRRDRSRHDERRPRHRKVTTRVLKLQNLRGQTLLFRCLETGFVTTAPALTRYQKARGVDPARRELVGERPANWVKEVPSTTCEHCGMKVKGNQWAFRQHQQSKRCLKAQQAA